MRTLLSFLLFSLSFATPSSAEREVNILEYVNPFIGTDGPGNTYPGAQYPFGMVQLSPDGGLPGWDRIAGYFYPDSTIAGFSHTHLSGTGAGDLYDISFLPITLPARISDTSLGLHSTFTHEEEKASPGYYAVRLRDYDIQVELTAGARTGIQRYRFPHNGRPRRVVLNLAKATNWDQTLASSVNKVDSCTIEGYRFSTGWAQRQRVWFRTRFSRPIAEIKYDTLAAGHGIVATFSFKGDETSDTLLVTTSLSPTDSEGARRNLESEAPRDDFNSLLTATRRAWNERLSVITVKGGSSRQRTTFYTALYHALLAPTLFQDMDGRYPGPDGKVHQNAIRRNYSTFSLWDTYRAAHPLYILLYPEDAADIVNSILDFARQNGRLPVWNMWASETDMMIGYHAASVISESVLKGLPEIDGHEALRLCRETAERDNYRGIGLYRRIGYVPVNVEDTTINNNEWSLSRTLEYAYDDACIARLARYVGEKKIARNYEHRAKNYRYVFDKETRFFRPRLIDGTFVSNFSPFVYDHAICESNAWHYLWNVPHDLKGLRRLMGKQHFAERLDSFFSVPTPREVELPIFSTGMIGQYAHGNEPSHHVAYLYNMIGRPERTTAYVHRILNDLYSDCPNGLAGNEDCGQMSAWAVFSAMGFYPVDPTSCRYETVAPIFPEIILHLHRPDGTRRDVVISRDGDGLRLNGRTLKGQSFSHSELLK